MGMLCNRDGLRRRGHSLLVIVLIIGTRKTAMIQTCIGMVMDSSRMATSRHVHITSWMSVIRIIFEALLVWMRVHLLTAGAWHVINRVALYSECGSGLVDDSVSVEKNYDCGRLQRRSILWVHILPFLTFERKAESIPTVHKAEN